ncbi:hypothetical protein D3C86_1547130 [compost metagenome]
MDFLFSEFFRSLIPLSTITPRAKAFPQASCGVTVTIGAMDFVIQFKFSELIEHSKKYAKFPSSGGVDSKLINLEDGVVYMVNKMKF